MRNSIVSAAAIVAAALFTLGPFASAWAVDFRNPRAQRDLTPALQRSLTDKVSDVAGPYFDEQDRKKAAGKPYVDLQQKFEYLPNYGPHNQLVVSVKLGGVEYDPTKSGSSKGASTGTLRYLVFTYALANGNWVEMNKPKWEMQALGAKAGEQMTRNQARGDQRAAAIEKARQTKAAAAAAAAAAQKAANQ
ncbi:MAG TPA: hypothetical protein VKB29_14650 [Candidatus Binataceae bacterium]|nr:hypothetical protein [Candidatus Binataceae bacterium]